MPQVFISYCREQRPYVSRLAVHLAQVASVEVWYDYELATGERWDNVVRRKIGECAALIVVMTPDAGNSHWVAEEVALARQLGKEVLPLLLEGTPIFGFMTVQHDDVRGGVMPGDRFFADLDKAIGPRPKSPTKPLATPTRKDTGSPPRGSSVERRWRLRVLLTTLAVAVSAGALIWSFVYESEPSDRQTSAGTSATASSTIPAKSGPATTSSIPPGRNVRLSVYNNSTIAGRAASACDDARAFGWAVSETGNYSQGTIPTTTVYFRPGTDEEASARELAALFRTRVEPRFDGIRSAAPGMILIVTNDYQGPGGQS